jgi:hypothetical protein
MAVEVTPADAVTRIQPRHPEVLTSVVLGLTGELPGPPGKAEGQHPFALVLNGTGRGRETRARPQGGRLAAAAAAAA